MSSQYPIVFFAASSLMVTPMSGDVAAEYVYGLAPACHIRPVMKPASLAPKSVMKLVGEDDFSFCATCLYSSQVFGTVSLYLSNTSLRYSIAIGPASTGIAYTAS